MILSSQNKTSPYLERADPRDIVLCGLDCTKALFLTFSPGGGSDGWRFRATLKTGPKNQRRRRRVEEDSGSFVSVSKVVHRVPTISGSRLGGWLKNDDVLCLVHPFLYAHTWTARVPYWLGLRGS